MKKMLATLKIIISILLLILLMAACSSTTTEPGNTTSESDTETTTETEDSTSAEPMAEETAVTEEAAPEEEPTAEETNDEEMADEEMADHAGGRVVVHMTEDLEVMNPDATTALVTSQVTDAVIEPLVQPDANGEYQPVLAERVPTEANGDITNDGKTVTWKLKEGVTWSDGTPFTSADVLFTYEVASNPDSGSVRTSAFEGITNIEAPDDHTVVIE